MIQRIILFPVLICLFLTAKSQANKFEYGFQGGLNLNFASGKAIDKDHKGILTGLNIGGHFKFYTAEYFGIKVLLSYDQNGYSIRNLYFSNNSTSTGLIKADVLTRVSYLNLPVLAEYSFGNKIRVNFDAGAFIGVLLNGSLITRYKEPVPGGEPSSITSPSTENKNKLNYGIASGFGVQLPIATKIKLDFDLHNYTGLASLYKSGSASRTEINCLTISAGLSFRL